MQILINTLLIGSLYGATFDCLMEELLKAVVFQCSHLKMKGFSLKTPRESN